MVIVCLGSPYVVHLRRTFWNGYRRRFQKYYLWRQPAGIAPCAEWINILIKVSQQVPTVSRINNFSQSSLINVFIKLAFWTTCWTSGRNRIGSNSSAKIQLRKKTPKTQRPPVGPLISTLDPTRSTKVKFMDFVTRWHGALIMEKNIDILILLFRSGWIYVRNRARSLCGVTGAHSSKGPKAQCRRNGRWRKCYLFDNPAAQRARQSYFWFRTKKAESSV